MKLLIPNDETTSLIEGIHTVAENIRSLAQSADEGRVERVDAREYAHYASYESLIVLLAQAGLASPIDALDPPSEDLKSKSAPVLEPAGFTLSQIYEDARKGAVFMMQQSWEAMKDAPEYPENPRTDYDPLHYCMAFLDVTPGSEELCDLLDTTPEVFARIDKSFALACAYESFRTNQGLVRLFTEQQRAAPPDNRGLAGQFAAARDFRQRYDEGAERVYKDIAVLMRKSQIRQEEVKFYFLTRLEIDGDLPLSADPREPIN
ncbi:MAG: hypothetical protein KA099_11040 [Alphaproteobacteria bacterium]|nr:hypothetical protein [Alphaproteobacteria bacterium]MBP7758489.1 hypothetical protein [Alphaproteobacteria bacterium]MBP7762770.1 hypothetical protein [Alphaproteobacteria bacterium]MBP7905852.1 hypothetical protein [Alphaproteobacteria bacterium]